LFPNWRLRFLTLPAGPAFRKLFCLLKLFEPGNREALADAVCGLLSNRETWPGVKIAARPIVTKRRKLNVCQK